MTLPPLSSEDIDTIRATAHAAADAARAVTLQYFRGQALETRSKLEGGFDPVTEADRGAETAMREVISRMRPEDAILGEEHGYTGGTSGLTWVLDPIDGTRAYISGTPTWGVLIGLRNEAGVVLGVIDQPYIGERFEGGFGVGALKGPHGTAPLQVAPSATLEEATIFTTFPEVGDASEGAAFHRLASQCKLTRYGMDCYAYALLAAGQIDLVVEAGLQSYDILGPIGVIEAAGGMVTNWQGGSALGGGQVIAAASKELHAAACAILSGHSAG